MTDFTTYTNLRATGDTEVGGDLSTTGDAEVGGNLVVTGDVTTDDGTLTADTVSVTTGLVTGSAECDSLLCNASYIQVGSGPNKIGFGAAAPNSGTWAKGDIVFNTGAAPSGQVGWVCTTAGTPGTWKTFGVIAS